ncbi:MAG: ABC transporter ATP-binding protein [Conexibacter sp.]
MLNRRPAQLSGGQRQRVAMGRAIVREPKAFLMDEPLSNLDAKLRVQTRAEILKLQDGLGTTTIYVTHDQVEAMTMGDRVAVMRRGVLQQVAPPQELYDRPVNVFVGGFIGSPAMNLLQGRIEDGNGRGPVLRLGEQSLALEHELLDGRPALQAWAGRELIVGIRPEDLHDAALEPDAPEDRRLRLDVQLREALGSEVIVHARVDVPPAETEQIEELTEDLGVRTLDGGGAEGGGEATVVARLSPHSAMREGETAEVAVDTRQLHFFDPETGLGIYDETPDGRTDL